MARRHRARVPVPQPRLLALPRLPPVYGAASRARRRAARAGKPRATSRVWLPGCATRPAVSPPIRAIRRRGGTPVSWQIRARASSVAFREPSRTSPRRLPACPVGRLPAAAGAYRPDGRSGRFDPALVAGSQTGEKIQAAPLLDLADGGDERPERL